MQKTGRVKLYKALVIMEQKNTYTLNLQWVSQKNSGL